MTFRKRRRAILAPFLQHFKWMSTRSVPLNPSVLRRGSRMWIFLEGSWRKIEKVPQGRREKMTHSHMASYGYDINTASYGYDLYGLWHYMATVTVCPSYVVIDVIAQIVGESSSCHSQNRPPSPLPSWLSLALDLPMKVGRFKRAAHKTVS